MSVFYVTFGCQYAAEPHPTCKWAHPNGYLAIEAQSYDAARAKAFDVTGGKFAFIYEKQPESRFFPWGELHRVTVQEAAS